MSRTSSSTPQPLDAAIVESPPILGSAVVAMVQPSQTSPRDHLTATDRSGPTPRGSFTQPEMGAVVMVIRDVVGEKPLQVSLVEWNDFGRAIRGGSFPPSPRPLPQSSVFATFHWRAGFTCAKSPATIVRATHPFENRELWGSQHLE